MTAVSVGMEEKGQIRGGPPTLQGGNKREEHAVTVTFLSFITADMAVLFLEKGNIGGGASEAERK